MISGASLLSRNRSPARPIAGICGQGIHGAAAAAFSIAGLITSADGVDARHKVRAAACGACHRAEYEKWRGAHHFHAMEPASEKSVRGNFNDTRFAYKGVTGPFFRRGKKYWVRTEGPNGSAQEFQALYTFGIAPSQQYLLRLPGGRLQALTIAWDTRPDSEPGHRQRPQDAHRDPARAPGHAGPAARHPQLPQGGRKQSHLARRRRSLVTRLPAHRHPQRDPGDKGSDRRHPQDGFGSRQRLQEMATGRMKQGETSQGRKERPRPEGIPFANKDTHQSAGGH